MTRAASRRSESSRTVRFAKMKLPSTKARSGCRSPWEFVGACRSCSSSITLNSSGRSSCPSLHRQRDSHMPTFIESFDPRTLAALEGLDFKARYIMEGFLSGLHQSPFHGFSVEFSDYRTYQPGDDLRHLDWRLFARSDRLCIKRYMQETNVRFYVVIDTSASMAYKGVAAWACK